MTCSSLLLAILGLGAALVAEGAPPPAPTPAPAPYSAADADALSQKLEALFRRAQLKKPPREKTISVTEPELNSYLNLTLAPKMPKGVSDVVVRFERDRLAVRALVDLTEVQGKIPAGALGGLLSFLSGKVPLEARGRLDSAEEGFSSFAIEEVNLSTIPVPVSVVEQLVTSATRTSENPHGFDIHSPFRLPYDLKRARLQPGRALLEY
ncbi:MAG TPA: hypothetical protein VMV21_04525 [Vicinamibacteria bacterium]|nr:hypothetical protein [Vicinamibacteria bacterium]